MGLLHLRARWYWPYLNQFISSDPIIPDYFNPQSLNRYSYARNNPINFTDPSGQICLDPWAPAGFHLDPSRGCEYSSGSRGMFWWQENLSPLEDTAIIDAPWVDEMDWAQWVKYPNSCGASALYMLLRAENKPVDFATLVQQLQRERPAGYDPYCCSYSSGWPSDIPAPTPDPQGWCNAACVSAETLAKVAREQYGMTIESGDGWTRERVHQKLLHGHTVLALIRSELGTNRNYFGHFVLIRGLVDQGTTVVFNDSYPGETYWGRPTEERRQVGEGREADWFTFDDSWKSAVDAGFDPLSPQGHVRWAMAAQ